MRMLFRTSTCTVVYTPSAYGTGTHNIRASYPGSAVHAQTADPNGHNIPVDTRSTTTTVDCQEPAVVGQDRTCTVTVTDTQSAGTKSDPSGTVTFSIFAGPVSFTPAPGPCSPLFPYTTLFRSSTCTVVYTPSAYGTGTHNIRASYPGS